MEKLKIGVLLSGSGTNLQAIIDEIANGLPCGNRARAVIAPRCLRH